METLEEKIVTIGRFPNSRALLLQSILKAEKIDCFLAHQNLLQPAVSSGVEIKVRRSDVEKAVRLIEQAKRDYGAQKEKAFKTLKSVRNILVPVDFSDASTRAGQFALELASKLKAEVHLLHAFYNPVIDVAPFDTSHSYQINLTNYLHEIEQNARKQMNTQVQVLKDQASAYLNKIKVTCSLSNGLAADEILANCRKYKPGLVVMGTRGMGNQTEGLVGSVTAKVIQKSDIPVLAVPENSRFTNVDKLKNILYATDFDDYDQVALAKLINLFHPFNITLHCVHVSVGIRKEWEKVKMESLKKFLVDNYDKFPVKCKFILSDTVINGLECYMRDNDIEVIALTNHSRGVLNNLFTPSVTRIIMARMNLPLFVFKASGYL